MLVHALRGALYLWLREWRARYPRAVSFLGEAFALGMSLAVYWYTSRAFAGHADFAQGAGYFTYVVVGEASLLLPMAAFAGLSRAARDAHAEGVLEALLVMPWSVGRATLWLGLPGLVREMLRAAVLLFAAHWISGAHLSALWVVAQLAALPLFLALGWMGVAYFLATGRGEAWVAYASTALAVLAGTYFPVTLFPEAIARGASAFSPFNRVMDASRGALDGTLDLAALAWLVGLGFVALLAASASLRAGAHLLRARGSVET